MALPLDASVRTGQLVLYQTVSFELISDLVVLEPQRWIACAPAAMANQDANIPLVARGPAGVAAV